MTQKMVKITVELTDSQAEELAQFLKRMTWSDIREKAADGYAADLMQEAMRHVGDSLAEVGYAPR